MDDIPIRQAEWEAPGVQVDRCAEPRTVEDLSQLLEWAFAEKTGALIVGGGTRLAWSNPARDIQLGISTLGLSGVDIFEPDEGVLHVRAGTTVKAAQETARESGWELPIDVAGASSTIGGVISTAATGPRAQAFGRVADAILGLEIVGSDGAMSKCGGRVVKNVTGYDLAKLYCGSFGTLGVISGAWLRLRPISAEKRAIHIALPADEGGVALCQRFARLTSVRALTWVEGVDADAQEGVYFEFSGSEAEVAHDLTQVKAFCATRKIDLEQVDALRDARARLRSASVLMRTRVLGTDCEAAMNLMRESGLAMSVDLGLGVVHARGSFDSKESLLGLRSAIAALGGCLTFERIPEEWRDQIDVFGMSPENEDLQSAIQAKFDPRSILNPGRFHRPDMRRP